MVYSTNSQELIRYNSEAKDVRSWNLVKIGETTFLQFQLLLRDLTEYTPIGYLTCHVDCRVFERFFTSVSTGYCLYDVRTDRHLLSTHLVCEQGHAEEASLFEETPFALVQEADTGYLHDYTAQYLTNSVYLLIILLICAALLSYLLAYVLERQFFRLLNAMTAADLSGVANVHLGSFVTEIEQLGLTFQEMAQRIRRLHEDIMEAQRRQYQLELSQKQAQLSLLQLQIRPHFLYNTLESIAHLILTNDGRRADEMLMRLSNMLRFVSRLETSVIPFEAELSYAQMYADIMLTRHNHCLRIHFSISPETLKITVVKFFLQPLIENAIDHCIRYTGHGSIDVSADVADGLLMVVVRDDGEGIQPDHLSRLKESLSQPDTAAGIGLVNIHTRIRLHFGDEYGLSISSTAGKGTVVMAVMPADKTEKDE